MNDYELVTIIDPEVSEEAVSQIMDEVSKLISDWGGTVDKMDKWGKRKLAYPIKKFMEGNYVLTCFKLEPKLVKEIETKVRTSEEILRHLVVKVGG